MKTKKAKRKPCDQCNILYINGVRCHEIGCPEAWKDYTIECFECGCDFKPTEKHQRLCSGCRRSHGQD